MAPRDDVLFRNMEFVAMAKSVHTGVAGLLLASVFSFTGCAAPYDTVAMRPDFEIHTQTGLAAGERAGSAAGYGG